MSRFQAFAFWCFRFVQGLEARLYGLRKRSIQLQDIRMSYWHRTPKKPRYTVVMLHGFTASKEVFIKGVRPFSEAQVILPDLAGHGESDYSDSLDYTGAAQARRIKELLDKLDVKQAVLVGNSMGGFIAATFALMYPQCASALVLLDAAGVPSPVPSRLDEVREKSLTLLGVFAVQTPEDFERLFAMSMARPPYVPRWMRRGIAGNYIQRQQQIKTIGEQFFNQEPLSEQLPQIKTPTLIIWGDQDELLHPSAAPIWHQQIKQSELKIQAGIGHMPMLENPKQTARQMHDFIQQTLA